MWKGGPRLMLQDESCRIKLQAHLNITISTVSKHAAEYDSGTVQTLLTTQIAGAKLITILRPLLHESPCLFAEPNTYQDLSHKLLNWFFNINFHI